MRSGMSIILDLPLYAPTYDALRVEVQLTIDILRNFHTKVIRKLWNNNRESSVILKKVYRS